MGIAVLGQVRTVAINRKKAFKILNDKKTDEHEKSQYQEK